MTYRQWPSCGGPDPDRYGRKKDSGVWPWTGWCSRWPKHPPVWQRATNTQWTTTNDERCHTRAEGLQLTLLTCCTRFLLGGPPGACSQVCQPSRLDGRRSPAPPDCSPGRPASAHRPGKPECFPAWCPGGWSGGDGICLDKVYKRWVWGFQSEVFLYCIIVVA